jgi:hydroxymethylbilane synthase
VRGNVDTRLRKLDEGRYDAVLLAEAGLRRLGLAGRITEVLPLAVFLPAVGQGALGLEIRQDDRAAARQVAPLDHAPTHRAVLAERAMLAALEGGCLAPVAAYAQQDGKRMTLTGRVLSADGTRKIESTLSAPCATAAHSRELGRRVAEELLAQGAAELIRAARRRS